MEGVGIEKIVKKLQLKKYIEDMELKGHRIRLADVNRPALQLNGFYEHFEENRIQMIGMVEYAYMNNKPVEERAKIYQKLLSYDIPCLIFCRGFVPEQSLMDVAHERKIPILGTDRGTSEFMSELIFELNVLLAPCATIHGVLVDVYGEGLLITGESGIGKSEAALELVRRGHRLVADDVVEIRKTNAHTLMGCAPTITKHFIELRGIGIIDVKSLFGVESIKERQRVDFVIKLEDWKKENDYDRLGLEDEYMNILGIDVTCHSLPIRPGRNLAVICETAAVNYRQKKMGYNAAQELYRRVQDNISHGQSE